MNERDPPSTAILQEGEKHANDKFLNSTRFMGGKKTQLICVAVPWFSVANQSYNQYPHIQLTDTGGFILFIVKHKTGILKVIKYTLKKYIYITKHWPHNCKYICWNVYIYTNTKNKPFFHFYTEILPPISSDRYFVHFQKHYFFKPNLRSSSRRLHPYI